MNDNRTLWELDWCLRVSYAADFLRYIGLTGVARQLAASWMHSVPEAWAVERINEVLTIANRLVALNGEPGDAARVVVADHVRALAEHRQALGVLEVL